MKTAMELALARIEMIYIEKDSIHWEMFKNSCIENEKEAIKQAFVDAYIYGMTNTDISADEYYKNKFNNKIFG
jgi:hypothetical protein